MQRKASLSRQARLPGEPQRIGAFSCERVKPKIMVLAHQFVLRGSFVLAKGFYFNTVEISQDGFGFFRSFLAHGIIVQETI